MLFFGFSECLKSSTSLVLILLINDFLDDYLPYIWDNGTMHSSWAQVKIDPELDLPHWNTWWFSIIYTLKFKVSMRLKLPF